MSVSYRSRIEDYCSTHGIEVPPGFRRHAASRYAAIDVEKPPGRLIAATWFKQEDLVYYLLHHARSPSNLRLLDFKDRQELRFDGKRLLTTGAGL